MKKLNKLLLTVIMALSLTAAGNALAWMESFSFGDSFGDKFNVGDGGWSTPDWGISNTWGNPPPHWGAPGYGRPGWGHPMWGPPGYRTPDGRFYPRASSYDRSVMKQKRQSSMSQHDDAMDSLADMLYGRYRFDRSDAIRYAREIETLSNENLWRNFYPGAIMTEGSRTAPSIIGNEETFRAYADAMRGAAADLAKELDKRPAAEEGPMYPNQVKGFDYRLTSRSVEDPISRDIYPKFDNLANTCRACHTYFRLPGW